MVPLGSKGAIWFPAGTWPSGIRRGRHIICVTGCWVQMVGCTPSSRDHCRERSSWHDSRGWCTFFAPLGCKYTLLWNELVDLGGSNGSWLRDPRCLSGTTDLTQILQPTPSLRKSILPPSGNGLPGSVQDLEKEMESFSSKLWLFPSKWKDSRKKPDCCDNLRKKGTAGQQIIVT